jgi:ATP-dependent HslUV protease ATP-binding subunit HslU
MRRHDHSKLSDMLPELQGRLPIRVELRALWHADLPQQYKALMATEEVSLDFTDDAIDAIARIAVGVNATVEDIVERRLQTVVEKQLSGNL